MKRHYKVKEKNITKLKTYLKDANTTFSNLEVILKILLLVVSIVYTLDKWWHHKKNR